jgi:16S rRNA (adenine1518-N6/adenine1519-N6)-dimethyltransferase
MKLDQHFVVDKDVLSRIIELADIKEDEKVLEIGSGTGNLTVLLAEFAKKVYAVEIDADLMPELEDRVAEMLNVELILGNALEVEWPEFDKMVSNIPYSLSEPLIQKLIFCDFKKAVLLVPKRFSTILMGKMPTKLSLIAQLFFDIKGDIEVYPDSFSPPPSVGSKVIIISPRLPEGLSESIFYEFLRQKDKIAKNALREAIIRGFEKESRKMTKNEARLAIKSLKMDNSLELRVSCLGLEDLLKIEGFLNNLTV